MLRTTPESLDETQPLTNEDESLVLVMDGRVDNWEELRRELLGKGAVLRTRADAELVLRAYEVWGCDFLARIDGDFALAIWDARLREVFCARDRIGNKPMHYHWNGKSLVFASELHPVWGLPWVERHLNEGMLSELLAWDVSSRDETAWTKIFRLMPANMLVASVGGIQTQQYWLPDFGLKYTYTRDEEYFEHYREVLTDSVRRLSRSHRPIACEVSGGLDSSALFCIADELQKKGQLAAPAFKGYTLGFEDQSDANELVYARAVGTHLCVKIHEVPPTRMPLAWYEKQALEQRDLLGYPNGVMCLDLWKQASLDGSRVLFNGVGGDEWLSGSPIYYAEELRRRHLGNLLKCLKADTAAFGAGQTIAWLLRYGCLPLLPDELQAKLKSVARSILGRQARIPYWLSPQMQRVLTTRRRPLPAQRHAKPQSIGQKELLDLLHDGFRVLSGEITERSLAHSALELRRPFNAVSMVQFAFATPERLRLSGGINKYIHVKALETLLPSLIHRRRTKAEFSSVFRAHLDQMRLVMLETIPCQRPEWLSDEGMRNLYVTYQTAPEKGLPLWALWSVYLCHNIFVEI